MKWGIDWWSIIITTSPFRLTTKLIEQELVIFSLHQIFELVICEPLASILFNFWKSMRYTKDDLIDWNWIENERNIERILLMTRKRPL